MSSSDVLVTVAALAKSLRAEEAAVRLLSGVDALVILERVRAIETFTTLLALIAPLAAMDQTVLIEDGSGEKALSTHQTKIWTLARVALANVVVQIWANGELPITVFLLANEGLHT